MSTKVSNTPQSKSSNVKSDTQSSSQSMKPGTVPKLNQIQETQLSEDLGSAITSINSSLKSLDEVKDIDLSSVN